MSASDLVDQWNELKVLIESLELDVLKNANGNKSAGVRARKGLRLLKQRSGDLVKSSLLSDKESQDTINKWARNGFDGVVENDSAGGHTKQQT